MTIAIGSDHAGYEYKEYFKSKIEKWGHTVIDLGPTSDASVDYPDFAHPVAQSVEKKEAALGVLICGSGNGVCMTANKHQDIRAALCWDEDIAKLARLHNDANIICLPARFVSKKKAQKMVDVFLKTEFEGGRHSNRVNKIGCV